MDCLIKDDWLGGILDRATYRVKYDVGMSSSPVVEGRESLSVISEIEQVRRNEKRSFFYVKVPSNEIRSIGIFELAGFRLVDTNVILTRSMVEAKGDGLIDDALSVGPAKADEADRVGEIAASAFELSRFHLDPQIGNDRAQAIKREWAHNYFLGHRGDHMVVCRDKELVTGFVLLLQPSDEELIIDLIAVDSRFRGRGIGRQMLEYVFASFVSVKTIIVGTQICNIPSLALYQKCNFFISSSSYVLHGHFKEDGTT